MPADVERALHKAFAVVDPSGHVGDQSLLRLRQARAVRVAVLPLLRAAVVIDPPALFPDSWVTSDHHFFHRNIARLQGRSPDHELAMVWIWRDLVADGDVVMHLGDLAFGTHSAERIALLASLPGQKWIVRGNHDRWSDDVLLEAGFRSFGRRPVLWADPEGGPRIAFSHEPARDDGSWDVNVHGHVHQSHPTVTGIPGGRARVNVCVDVRALAPVRLRDLLGEARAASVSAMV